MLTIFCAILITGQEPVCIRVHDTTACLRYASDWLQRAEQWNNRNHVEPETLCVCMSWEEFTDSGHKLFTVGDTRQ